jgi:hypothetical protein
MNTIGFSYHCLASPVSVASEGRSMEARASRPQSPLRSDHDLRLSLLWKSIFASTSHGVLFISVIIRTHSKIFKGSSNNPIVSPSLLRRATASSVFVTRIETVFHVSGGKKKYPRPPSFRYSSALLPPPSELESLNDRV